MPIPGRPYYLGMGVTPWGCRMDGPLIYDGDADSVPTRYGEMAERLNAPDSKPKSVNLIAINLVLTTARTEADQILSNIAH
jgi:hypothetical protein